MKVKISRETLMRALQIVQPVVSSSSRLKIMSHIIVEASKEKSGLNIMASNESMFIRCVCDADIKKAGAVVLNSKVLFNVLRVMKSDDVSFEVGDGFITEFKCTGASFKLVGMSKDDVQGTGLYVSKYRDLSDEELLRNLVAGGDDEASDEMLKFDVEQSTFKEMLANTIYAVSPEESRIPFNSVFFGINEKTLSTIATDARRLALMEYEVNVSENVNIGLLVPSRTVSEVINILGDSGSVTIYCSKKMIGLNFGSIQLVSKLVDASYPNYRQAIPSSCDFKIKADREQLLNAVRRASSLYIDGGTGDAIIFMLSKNKMNVMAEKKNVGEYNEELSVTYDGRDMKMSFDATAFIDPLRTLTIDEITIEVTDELSPIVMKCSKPFIYVLMPINIK